MKHINCVADAWQTMVAEPLNQGMLGPFFGPLTGFWEKPGRKRLIAMLHMPEEPHATKSDNRAFPATCQGEVQLDAMGDAIQGRGVVMFVQIALDDHFCELGIGHLLADNSLYLRRGDCEPKRVPGGPCRLLDHIFVPDHDWEALSTLNTICGDSRAHKSPQPAFAKVPWKQSAKHKTGETYNAHRTEHAYAISAVKKELLLQYGLHTLARLGHVNEAEEMLTSDAEVNVYVRSYADDGLTPLHVASREGHVGMARLLLSHGALVNQRRLGHRSTALHYAIQYCHEDVVELLLQNGARVDQKSWGHFKRADSVSQGRGAWQRWRIRHLLQEADPASSYHELFPNRMQQKDRKMYSRRS
jgi:hypothetical protein